MAATAILIGCVAGKRERPRPARDLHSSPLFRRRRAYAEASGFPWAILSARYGLLHPEMVVDPYEHQLRRPEIAAWSERLRSPLAAWLGDRLDGATLEVHAGVHYVDGIRRAQAYFARFEAVTFTVEAPGRPRHRRAAPLVRQALASLPAGSRQTHLPGLWLRGMRRATPLTWPPMSDEREAAREKNRAWIEQVDAALPPYERGRPRDPDMADYLRSIGTPENLIGPVPDRAALARVRVVLAESLDEGAAEQWLWHRLEPALGNRPPVALLLEGREDEVIAAARQATASAG